MDSSRIQVMRATVAQRTWSRTVFLLYKMDNGIGVATQENYSAMEECCMSVPIAILVD